MGREIVNQDQPSPVLPDPAEGSRLCPACGAETRRTVARFCSTCGRSLSDSYLPADALRSSYHLQHRPRTRRRPKGIESKIHMTSSFSSGDGNAAAKTALAFVTYSLVPYLGILFCPGAVILGAVGLLYSIRAPHRSGRRAAYFSIAFGLVVLCVQILLWWIITKVPEWTRPF